MNASLQILETLGFHPHPMPGASQTAIGITGNIGAIDPARFENLPGVAVGADGLIIEVHPCPEEALCDGAQALTPEQYTELVRQVKALHNVLVSELLEFAAA